MNMHWANKFHDLRWASPNMKYDWEHNYSWELFYNTDLNCTCNKGEFTNPIPFSIISKYNNNIHLRN